VRVWSNVLSMARCPMLRVAEAILLLRALFTNLE